MKAFAGRFVGGRARWLTVAVVSMLAFGVVLPLASPGARGADQSWMVPGHWFRYTIHTEEVGTNNVSESTYTARIVTVGAGTVRVNETWASVDGMNSTSTENDVSRTTRQYLTTTGEYAWFWVNEADLNTPTTYLASKTATFVSATGFIATFNVTEPSGNMSTVRYARSTLVLDSTTDIWFLNGTEATAYVVKTGEGYGLGRMPSSSGPVIGKAPEVPAPTGAGPDAPGTRSVGGDGPGTLQVQSFSPPWNWCIPNAVRSVSWGGTAGVARAEFPCNANTGRSDSDVSLWASMGFGWAFARGTANSRGPAQGQFRPLHSQNYRISLTYTIVGGFAFLQHTECGWWGCGYVHQFAWVHASVFSTSSGTPVVQGDGSVYWGYCFPIPFVPCIQSSWPTGQYTVVLGTVALSANQDYYFILQDWAEHYAFSLGWAWNSSIGLHQVRFDVMTFQPV